MGNILRSLFSGFQNKGSAWRRKNTFISQILMCLRQKESVTSFEPPLPAEQELIPVLTPGSVQTTLQQIMTSRL